MKISSAVLCKLRGLSSSEWFWGCREASKSGLSSFGVGNVTVSVIRIPGLNIIIIESVFGLIWPYSSKTSPKLGYKTARWYIIVVWVRCWRRWCLSAYQKHTFCCKHHFFFFLLDHTFSKHQLDIQL